MTDIVAGITERENVAFTITSATVKITEDGSNTVLRNNVTASFDTDQVFFHEDFTTANGYKENTCYTATFKVNITRGVVTFREKAIVQFQLTEVADE